MAGAAYGEEVAVLEFIIDAVTPKGVLEARDADLGLGVEGRGGLDGAAAVVGGSGEEDGLKPCGEFVLAALTGDHDGEGEALAVLNATHYSFGYLQLVGP